MRELAKVVVAVAVTELALWGAGVWSWVSYSLRRWPWLLDRYALIFPLILVVVLLALRRWSAARSHFVVGGLTGAAAGLLASEFSSVLAQVVTAQERATLWSTWRTASAADLLLVESVFAFILTLGWVYGAAASTLALVADRAEKYLQDSREQTGSPAGS